MPRARCHWALLLRTRDALSVESASAYGLVRAHRAEYLAGGMAPDALRIFAGGDKPSTHFYDDKREETWHSVVEAIQAAHPEVARPDQLEPSGVAWILGYLTHVMTDVAYWRHVLTRLPPFPAEVKLHFGAWVLADRISIPAAERHLNLDSVRYDAAPPWVGEAAMRQMLERVHCHFLPPQGMWSAEVAYSRVYPHAIDRSDDQILEEWLPRWRASVTAAKRLLPREIWTGFYADAIASSVSAVIRYLGPS
jgi:hypothetical protein